MDANRQKKDNEKAEANRKAMLARGIIPGNYKGRPENYDPDYKRKRGLSNIKRSRPCQYIEESEKPKKLKIDHDDVKGPWRTKQEKRENPIKEDYKYQVIGTDYEKSYHPDPLSVGPGEVVTIRNICPHHQDCGFILVNNQFSESGYVQKSQLQSYGQADISFCFLSPDCKKTFSCPQGFEEHLCMDHFYEDLKLHITKGHQRSERRFYCPERGCSRHSEDLGEIILHYGVEHHRVQSLVFNHLRHSDIHEEYIRDNRLQQQQIEELKSRVDDQNQREDITKKEYRRMEDVIKEERNLVDERTEEVTRLEMEMEELKKKVCLQDEVSGEKQRETTTKLLEEKSQQVSKLELQVKEKCGHLKEKNKKCEELSLAHETLNIMLKNKEKEIFHLTNELQKTRRENGNK